MGRSSALYLCSIVLLLASPSSAAPASAPAEDPLGPPTQLGIRMTPGIARALAQQYTRQFLQRQYGLDEARAPEAAEAVARRFMAAAHATDGACSDMLESIIARNLMREAAGQDDEVTPEFGKELARHITPMLPTLRELVRGVGQDVRPMLPIKGQLGLMRDLVLADTALNAFDQNMQRWGDGGAEPGENPFEPGGGIAKRDATGQSQALKSARHGAESMVALERLRDEWQKYLEQARKFYGFDAAQAATGDSLVREFVERARPALQDAAWRDEMYRNSMWATLVWSLRIPGTQALADLLRTRYQELNEPLVRLANDFKARVDQIPTEGQRAAAEARLMATLAAQGYQPEKR